MKQPSPLFLLLLLASAKFFSLGGLLLASAAESTTCQTSSPTLPAAPSTLDLASLVAAKQPIVYTIAGSDSGGGAGIQADLHAIHALGGHGCSAITCLTAQNSVGVTGVHAATDFLQAQLAALRSDLPPAAVKIGMLGTRDLVVQVGVFCQQLQEDARLSGRPPVWIVLDPVMIATSGARLIEQDAQQAMVNLLFPHVDLVTPNKYEAEALLGRTLDSTADVEQGARDLLAMGVRAVLIKGGHMGDDDDASPFAQDYFLSSQALPEEPRNCDGGVWLRSTRYDTVHTHGTGCTLSSALATALALQTIQWPTVTDLIDATTLAKAYVTAGIAQGVGLGQGPGPVGQTVFPQSHQHFPRVLFHPNAPTPPPFIRLTSGSDASTGAPGIGKILILVDSLEWIQKLVLVKGVTDVQLRIKGETDHARIVALIRTCNQLCEKAGVRLWINDYWEAAIEGGCFGVHMGQEDLYRCQQTDGLTKLREAGMALGLSTHSYGELAAALAVEPSYISLGPIFGTTSKDVNFGPQGLAMVQQWRRLVPPDMPLVVRTCFYDPLPPPVLACLTLLVALLRR
jgi:hydroxymethylpyrimidine kinase/phosphomethylpyrimidine kinase/thiamine-phosphate diphosphorylase